MMVIRTIGVVLVSAVVASVGLAEAAAGDQLLELVTSGNRAAVRAALDATGVDANAAEADGTTALHWAVHLDDVDIVDMLVAAGADASARNRYGATPLSLAAINGSARVIARLLEAGADANWASREGETALMTAARTGRVAAVKQLLAGGADVNAAETFRGQTALMWAVAEGHRDVAETLLRSGAEVDARSEGGFSALLFAVRAGGIDTVRALLAAGADVDGADEDGNTPMVLAILNGHYALADLLAEAGADPNIGTPGGTALHHAVRWRNYEFAEFWRAAPPQTGELDPLGLIARLLAHGADPNAPMTTAFPRRGPFDNNWRPLIGATPLHIAARAGDAPATRVLLAAGASPHAVTEDGLTTLMLAAGMLFNFERSIGTEAERLETVELLWSLGVDIHARTGRGETAVHGAARSGTTSVVRFLFDHGAAIDDEDDDTWTPLENADGTRSHFSNRPETAALLRELLADRRSAPRPR